MCREQLWVVTRPLIAIAHFPPLARIKSGLTGSPERSVPQRVGGIASRKTGYIQAEWEVDYPALPALCVDVNATSRNNASITAITNTALPIHLLEYGIPVPQVRVVLQQAIVRIFHQPPAISPILECLRIVEQDVTGTIDLI